MSDPECKIAMLGVEENEFFGPLLMLCKETSRK
jgi:hypothetical protein